jgi:hypothetical protein
VSDRPIIVFDAPCLLSSANAQFVLKHDRSARFRLASVQSEAGAALCRCYRLFGRRETGWLPDPRFMDRLL